MIHIVDDEEPVRLALRLLLYSYGWAAQTFPSARDFLDALPEKGAPDCLLLDLNMPGMSGADLLEEMAERKLDIPTIIITGRQDPDLAGRALRAGAVEVLSKPLRDDELKSSIDRILQDV